MASAKWQKLFLIAAGFIVTATLSLFGQANASQQPGSDKDIQTHPHAPLFDFAMATIRPYEPGDGNRMFGFGVENGFITGISITDFPVQALLREAFEVEDDRIFGAPGWVKSEPYDIRAKLIGPDKPRMEAFTRDQSGLAIQSLLVNRFNLKFHRETKELPVYALTVAGAGSKLKESKPYAHDANGAIQFPRMQFVGKGHLEAQATSLETLIRVLSQQVGHSVLDKTGLTSSYDFTLQWSPDDTPSPTKSGDGGRPGKSTLPPQASGPSLFTALQEQLGLKLEPENDSVDVIVIDHIERPSPN